MNKEQFYVFKSENHYHLNNLFNHVGVKRWRIIERTIVDNMLVFCLGGSGSYVIEGVRYEVKKGRIFFISHDVSHFAYQSDEDDPVTVIAMRFSIGADNFPPFYLSYDCQDFNGYYAILQLLIKYYQRYEGSIPTRNTDMLLRAFFQLFSAELDFYVSNEYFDEKMEVASRMIEERLNSQLPISLQDLLDETRLSK